MTSAAPPMSTTEQKAKTSSAKHIPPNEVAWMFVQEYYTFVNKNPHQLHRFYTKNSSMVHGSEAIKVEPFNGQLEIHNKILELDFQDCKVCISNVDSLASISGGIIVQVLGELSNKGGPSYKFAQTFFLAEQPGGYYVLNDIFRYLKDEVDFDYENEGGEERAAAASKDPDVAVESEEIEKEPSIPSIPSSPIMAPHVTPPVVPEPEESKPDIERPASPVKAPATPEIPASSDKPETTAPAIIETPKQETNGWGNKREPSPARPAPSAPAAMQKQESARAGNAEKPKTSGAKPSPSTPSGPAPKQSWATLAANDANRWKKDNLAEVKGSVAHVSTPTNAKSSALPQSNQPPASAPTGQGMRENKEKPRQNDPNASIFVKGVVQGVTRDMLIASFSVVGEVINCDVNPSKGSAFVDFATVDSAHKAIAQGTFTTSNGSVVHAEEKRIRFYPRHPGGRGGFANRGNPNYQRGDGTDTRGGRGRGRSDMQGGGKGRAGSAASAEKAGGAK